MSADTKLNGQITHLTRGLAAPKLALDATTATPRQTLKTAWNHGAVY